MSRRGKFIFSKSLQACTEVLREDKLLEHDEFVVLVTPITQFETVVMYKKNGLNRMVKDVRFVARIRTPRNCFDQEEIWVKFNSDASYVSYTVTGHVEKVKINIFEYREMESFTENTG